MLKDKLLFQNNSVGLRHKCFSCGSETHRLVQCHYLFPKFDVQKIVKKYVSDLIQKRDKSRFRGVPFIYFKKCIVEQKDIQEICQNYALSMSYVNENDTEPNQDLITENHRQRDSLTDHDSEPMSSKEQ